MSSAPSPLDRWVRGGLVALIGLGALALPTADYSTHVSDPWWGPESLAGHVVLIVLSSLLVAGGAWLATRDWETKYLTTVVVWTYAVSTSVTVLFAWAIALQLWVVGDPEPYVIAVDGVLIAALAAFTLGVLKAKNNRDSEELRRSEAEYRALAEEIIDSSGVATVVTDEAGAIAWLNRAAADYFGVDRQDAVGRDREAVVDSALADDPEPVEGTDVADTNQSTFECRVLSSPEREARWLERCSQRIEEGLHAGGRIEQYTDVTAHREAATTLAAREEGIRRMYEVIACHDATVEEKVDRLVAIGRDLLDVEYGSFARVDGDGEYRLDVIQSTAVEPSDGEELPAAHIQCRRAVEEAGSIQVASRPFDHTVGRFRFDHAATDGGTEAGFETYLGAPVTIGDETLGTLCFLDTEATEFEDWEQTLVELIARWVGYELERERLLDGRERRLAQRRNQLDTVVQSVDEYAIFTVGTEGRITSWNAGAQQVFGYDAEQVIGENASFIAAEEAENGWLTLRAAEEERVSGADWSVRADGSRFWAEFTISARYDGDEVRGYTVVVRDMTDRRVYEETIEHERERLEFINRVVRHNILNGLNVLNARAELLEDAAETDPAAADHLDIVRGRIDEMSDLIETIQQFMDAVMERPDHVQKPVPVQERLTATVESVAESHEASFRVHDLPDRDCRIGGDELVERVFENVLTNAVEHNDAADPTVDVWTSESVEALPIRPDTGLDSAEVTEAGSVADILDEETEQRRALTVHIADNGPGIPAETRRAMLSRDDAGFDDPSHGFGFFLVREMMESYGGGVRIRENEPRGTVVELVFPVHDETGG